MTNKVLLLTKIFFKNNFAAQFSSKSKKPKKSKSTITIIVLLLLFGLSIVPMIFSITEILKVLPGLEKLLLYFALPVAGLTTLIFSVFNVVGMFYFSKDQDALLSLPVKAKDLMLAKYFASLLTSYIMLIILELPVMIGVGIALKAGIVFYLYSLLIFLITPIIPSIISCIIVMIVLSFVSVGKSKNFFMYAATIITIIFLIGYSYISQTFLLESLGGVMPSISSLEAMYLPYLKSLFPFYNSAITSLLNYNNFLGFASIMTFIGINFIILFIFYNSFGGLYLKGVTKNSGTSNKKKINAEGLRKIKKGSTFFELVKKDWLVIRRTPTYMLNLVLILLIVPFVFVVSMIVSTAGTDDISILLEMINLNSPTAYLVIIIAFLLFLSTSAVSATAISREGNSFWFMKAIPVDYRTQINAKVFLGFLIDVINTILIFVPLAIMFKIDFVYALLILIPLIIYILILNYLGILLDLKRPSLNWSNEIEAVKQNVNVLYAIFISIFICLIPGALILLISKTSVELDIFWLFVILTSVSLILLFVIIFSINKNKQKLFTRDI